jgi:3-hydroxyacyl-CoA dehydrogenase
MGSQIAGLLADRGIPCDLLDLRDDAGAPSALAEGARERLLTLKPPPLSDHAALELIKPGNFDDDLHRIAEADWIIEAVSENLAVKRAIWSKVAAHARPDAIVSTNTSGIPVATIAEALPPQLRPRFLGAHFCNPPRYVPLLEVISTPETDPEVASTISEIASTLLERGVVTAYDVPNFIANRIGAYSLMLTLKAMDESGLGPDEVDSITGYPMGRPSSATFRTLDVVGIDVFLAVVENSLAAASDEDEKAVLEPTTYVRELVKRGWVGQKAGRGFYRRVKVAGKSNILALDVDSFEYRERRHLSAPSLEIAAATEDVAARLRGLVMADDAAGHFAWRILSRTLAYSASMVGVVAEDVVSIDRAMRWGYAWESGPFATWDALGVAESVSRMEADGISVPDWIADIAAQNGSFYRHGPAGTTQATPQGSYAPVSQSSLP